jgi:hypothetical protein
VRHTVKVSIKSRLVTVEGPRGKLIKNLSHISVNFSVLKPGVIGLEIHHGVRKNVAALRTVRTLINNMIIGVTKGFKYKMRYVYAHFPINVNVDQNAETGNYEVEIRYVPMEQAFWRGGGRWESDVDIYIQEIGRYVDLRKRRRLTIGCATVTSSARRLSGGS